MRPDKIFEQYSKALTPMLDGDMLISVHQAIYRIFALNNPEWQVLHGAAVTMNGKAILFGDNGTSIGKTTQSVKLFNQLRDVGRASKYIADEFVIYRKGYIYANRHYPVHIREGNQFVLMDEYIRNPVKLHAIICPFLGDKLKLTRLHNSKADLARKCTAYSHLVKLEDPSCDRASLFRDGEEVEVKDVREAITKYPEFDKIPVYNLEVVDGDLIQILEEVTMTKPIKNHISCGGVLFNESGDSIYLIYKKERKEYLLPKGHVEEGETHTDTALREVYEETGYKNLELVDTEPVGVVEYDFELKKDPGFDHHKTVKFYRMRLRDDEREETIFQEEEGLGGKWFKVSEVLKGASFDNEREIIRKIL